MPFYIVAAIIFIYAFYDYKKAFICFLGLKYLLVTNITVLSIPGIPLLSLDNLMTILFVGLFMFKGDRAKHAKISLPWMTPFILLSLTWVCCSVFSAAGVIAELSTLLANVIQEVMIVWVMWETIETKEDFVFILKVITFLTFTSCLYGIYEYITNSNPLNIYEESLNHDPSRVVQFEYSINTIRGYRVRSVFEHPIGAGVNWAMYIAFIAMAYVQFEEKIVGRFIYIITAVLCLPGIILSKMRSGYFFLLIAILACVNFRKKRFYHIVLLGIGAAIVLWPIIWPNIGALISIFTGDTYAGSDAATRFDQFAAAFELMKESPVTGLGEKFHMVYSGTLVKRLLGLESIWLKVIVAYGAVGILTYLIAIFYSVVVIPRYYRSLPMMFIALAYWMTYSLTSLPGVHTYLFYLIMIYCAKKSEVYKNLGMPRLNEWKLTNWKLAYKKVYIPKFRIRR